MKILIKESTKRIAGVALIAILFTSRLYAAETLRVPLANYDALKEVLFPTEDSRPHPIYGSMDDMLEGLTSEIPEKLKERGLNDNDIETARELLHLVEEVYTSMGLLKENYHNHVHNLVATYTMLLFTEDLEMSNEDIKATYIAALFHDFHVRDKVDSNTGNGTPAFVEETLRQLADILGIEKYPGPAVNNARYAGKDSRIDRKTKDALKGAVVKFLGTEVTTAKLYPYIAAMIRRTDFSSDVAPPHQTYKQKASIIRSMMNKAIDEGTEIGIVTNMVESEYIKAYEALEKDADIKSDQIENSRIWLDRQKGIEISYLEALAQIKPQGRLLFHALSHRLEKGSDQAGFYYLATPQMVEKEIIVGLNKEIPMVNAPGSYPFFFNAELLIPSVLIVLSALPDEYKDTFCNVMGYFANLSSNVGKSMDSSIPVKELFENAEKDWQAKEEKIAYLLGASRRLLRNSFLGGFLDEEELGTLISKAKVTMYNEDTILMEQGDAPGEVGVCEILSGEAEVVINGETVAVLGKGSIVGEMAVINGSTRAATVVLREGAIIAEIDHETFRHFYNSNDGFKESISKLIQSRSKKNLELLKKRGSRTGL